MSYREEFNGSVREAKWSFWKIFWVVVPILIVLTVVGWGLKTFVFQPAEVITKTTNADHIIYNYQWFHDQYEAVKATDTKIGVTESAKVDFEEVAGDRENWTWEDKREINQLNAELRGLKNHRASLVADYNSRSKQLNRNLFKSDNLPHTLQ